MSDFKIGDSVKLKPLLDNVDVERGKVYTVLDVRGILIRLVGFTTYKSAHIFNKVNKHQEEINPMSVFNKDDNVRRIAKNDFGSTVSGGVYQVLCGEPLVFVGCEKYNYDPRSFELVEPTFFEVGDKVKRIGCNHKDSNFGDIGKVTSVSHGGKWLDIDGSIGQPYYYGQYCLVEEVVAKTETVNLKVGDEVRRTYPSLELNVGEIYIVKSVFSNDNIQPMIEVEGSSNGWRADRFELVEVELESIAGVLSPQEVVEHYLAGDKLQHMHQDEKGIRWFDCGKIGDYRLHALINSKFRLKPASVTINGIEVAAPLPKPKTVEQVWGINFTDSRAYSIRGRYSNDCSHYWATKEDAEKVLAAMLLPFNTGE